MGMRTQRKVAARSCRVFMAAGKNPDFILNVM